LDGVVKDINKRMEMINCYGTYSDREVFWEGIKREGLINEHNLILGGDLNIATSSRKVWGEHARVDPLQIYFIQLIHVGGPVDVKPVNLLPTWRNGIRGHDYISKR